MVATSSILVNRVVLSLKTLPSTSGQWYAVGGITLGTTVAAGTVATLSGFCDPWEDWNPPSRQLGTQWWWKPLSAFFVPALLEEVLWRGLWIPHPAVTSTALAAKTIPYGWAVAAWATHTMSHPILGRALFWPRGKDVFGDSRFLLLAAIVLGGATASYLASGGSAWAAALTHGLPVVLWRDWFSGERKLVGRGDEISL